MRFSDWQSRLATQIRAAQQKQFTWGEQDCALFACNCIEAVTGKDPAADFRGKYDSKISAYQALRDYAGGGLVEVIEKITGQFGYREISPAFAQRGDLALCFQNGEAAMAIVSMNGSSIMVAAEEGLLFQPSALIARAWRIE